MDTDEALWNLAPFGPELGLTDLRQNQDYESATGMKTVQVGDFVEVYAEKSSTYIARVIALGLDGRGVIMACMQWFYRNHEVPSLRDRIRRKGRKNEILLSNHIDLNPIETIMHRVAIRFTSDDGQEFTSSTTEPNPIIPKFVCGHWFDTLKQKESALTSQHLMRLRSSHEHDTSATLDGVHSEAHSVPTENESDHQEKLSETSVKHMEDDPRPRYEVDVAVNRSSEALTLSDSQRVPTGDMLMANGNDQVSMDHNPPINYRGDVAGQASTVIANLRPPASNFALKDNSHLENASMVQSVNNDRQPSSHNIASKRSEDVLKEFNDEGIDESETNKRQEIANKEPISSHKAPKRKNLGRILDESSEEESDDRPLGLIRDESQLRKHLPSVAGLSENNRNDTQNGAGSSSFSVGGVDDQRKREAIAAANRALSSSAAKVASPSSVLTPTQASVSQTHTRQRNSISVDGLKNAILSSHRKMAESLVRRSGEELEHHEGPGFTIQDAMLGLHLKRAKGSAQVDRLSNFGRQNLIFRRGSDHSLIKPMMAALSTDNGPVDHREELGRSGLPSKLSLWGTTNELRRARARIPLGLRDNPFHVSARIRIGGNYQAEIPVTRPVEGNSLTRDSPSSACIWAPNASTSRVKQRMTYGTRGNVVGIQVADSSQRDSDGNRRVMWARVCQPPSIDSPEMVRVCPFDVAWPKVAGDPSSFIPPSSSEIYVYPVSDIIFDSFKEEAMMYSEYTAASSRGPQNVLVGSSVSDIIPLWSEEEYDAFCKGILTLREADSVGLAISKVVKSKTPKQCTELFWSPRSGVSASARLACSSCKTESVSMVACKRYCTCRTVVCVNCFQAHHGYLFEIDREELGRDPEELFVKARFNHWFCLACVSHGDMVATVNGLHVPVNEADNSDTIYGRDLARRALTVTDVLEIHSAGLISAKLAMDRVNEIVISEASRYVALDPNISAEDGEDSIMR